MARNIQFQAQYAGRVTSMTINGTVYAVKFGQQNEITLVENNWYSCILDDTEKTINFARDSETYTLAKNAMPKTGGTFTGVAVATTATIIGRQIINNGVVNSAGNAYVANIDHIRFQLK